MNESGFTDIMLRQLDRDHPPKLCITQCGRFTFWIQVTHRMLVEREAFVFGRGHAQRKGARMFARYLAKAKRERQWESERIEIAREAR